MEWLECKKCCTPDMRRAKPHAVTVTSCERCGGMVMGFSSGGIIYTGNPDALSEHIVENGDERDLRKISNAMSTIGTSNPDIGVMQIIKGNITWDSITGNAPAYTSLIGLVVLLSCKAGRRGKGHAVCYNPYDEKVDICGPGERFETTLYECAGKNATIYDVYSACGALARAGPQRSPEMERDL